MSSRPTSTKAPLDTDDFKRRKLMLLEQFRVLEPLISGPSSDLITFLKANVLDEYSHAMFDPIKGKVLFSIIKKHVVDPQTLKGYFGRLPFYVDPLTGRTACHLVGALPFWPDVWKSKFIQLYLNENINAIDIRDRKHRSIIDSIESARAKIYVVRSITLRRIVHFLWMSMKCPEFIIAKVTPNLRRLLLTKYI